jgi:hypothetical protein
MNGIDDDAGDDDDNNDSDNDAGDDDDIDYSSYPGDDNVELDSRKEITVYIPNGEIRGVFRAWLRRYMVARMAEDTLKPLCIQLFQTMVQGPMASFAEQFSKLVWEILPKEFLGSRENVYQSYVSGFMTAAAEAAAAADLSNRATWDIRVEANAGIGRLDLVLQRAGDNTGVIHEHKRIKQTETDKKKKGYGSSQRTRLTRKTNEAMNQLNTRAYRAAMKNHVTQLREYGIAFLGRYCAIEGRLLERSQGGPWVVKESYTANSNETCRAQLYTTIQH